MINQNLNFAVNGAIGALVAFLFVLIFRSIGWLADLIHHRTILLTTQLSLIKTQRSRSHAPPVAIQPAAIQYHSY